MDVCMHAFMHPYILNIYFLSREFFDSFPNLLLGKSGKGFLKK